MAKGRPKLSQEESDSRKSELIKIAKNLFAEHGYQSVSMRKLASKANISPMSLYQSFENKRDLLRYIWTDIFLDLQTHCENATKAAQSDELKLIKFCEAFFYYWIENPEHYRVVYLESDQLENKGDAYFVENEVVTELLTTLSELASRVAPNDQAIQLKVNLLILQLQGIAHGLITISELAWGTPDQLFRHCINGFVTSLDKGQ